MLTQQQQNGDYQPIAYGSQALTLTESYYSQTEPEALAVVWSSQHFHYYVYDNKTTTTIITDHKPLEKLLFSTSRVLPHVFRDGYYYYKPMTLLSNPADYLLRHPSRPSHQQCAKHYLNRINTLCCPKIHISIDQIENETSKDFTLQYVIESIQTNNSSKHLLHNTSPTQC